MLIQGRTVNLILIISFSLITYYLIERAKKGAYREVRRMPALDGIEEMVKRAAEMGRPIQMTPGMGLINSAYGAQTIAGLGVLSHLTKLCAKDDVDLIVSVYGAANMPATEAVVQQGYEAAGKPEMYTLGKQVRYLSDDQFAWVSGMLGTLERERCAGQILIGLFMAEALLLVEAGKRFGAIQIAGTAFIANIPFFVVSSDYCLITEEIFAASAYLTNEPDQIGSIGGQDMARIILLAIMLIGIISAVLGSNMIYNLLGM